MRWMDTLSKVQVMRWMDTNTVKCLQVMRWIDKNRHQSPSPPACSNESLAHSYHTNRTNFLPRDMNETAANASAYIACKGIYESKTDYNCRSTKLGENDGKGCLMTNVNIKKKKNTTYLFSAKKSCSIAPHGNAARRKWRITARM